MKGILQEKKLLNVYYLYLLAMDAKNESSFTSLLP